METSTKDRFDLVTNVDKQIQNHFQNFLQEHYPTHQLLAEEKDNSDITLTRVTLDYGSYRWNK